MKRLALLSIFLYVLSFLIICQSSHAKPNKIMLNKFFSKSSKDFYTQAWAEVDSLMKQKGLPKSALELLDKIYQRAQKDKEYGHLTKAIIYKINITNYTEEDGLVKGLTEIQEEIKSAPSPVKSLLHMMQGEMYWQYYQNNRYRIYQRTTVEDKDPNDVKTWDARLLVEKTLEQYELALEDEENLKNTQIDVIDKVVLNGEAANRALRPTLYDFIGHRVLRFYTNAEAGLNQAVYQFYIDDAKYFSPVEEFIQIPLTTKDSTSFKFKALKLYQDLLKFHYPQDATAIWADVDTERLGFVLKSTTLSNREELILEALQNLSEKVKEDPIWAKVNYVLATFYHSQGQKYDPKKGDAYKWLTKTALELCNSVPKTFPESPYVASFKALQANILEEDLDISIPSINPSERPFPALLNYRNVTKVYWKAVVWEDDDQAKVDKLNQESSLGYEEVFIDFLNRKKTVLAWTSELPDDQDYQSHSVEEKIPTLPFGNFMILASADEKFSLENHKVAYGRTTISDLTFVKKYLPQENVYEFYVMNRVSGFPEPDVSIEVFQETERYNRQKINYQERKVASFRSDEEGYFQMPTQNRYGSLRLVFSKGEDRLQEEDYYSNYNDNNHSDNEFYSTHFFLDRGIYRPGQTVYFKGIILKQQADKSEIAPNYSTTVRLYDVNGQMVKELLLVSNEYGTFNGQFMAPNTGLNGEMTIRNFSTDAVQAKTHMVKKGENLYRIARQYNLSMQEIQRWNQMQTDQVEVGQKLIIKNPEARNASPSERKRLGLIRFSVEEYKRPTFEVTFEPIKGTFKLNDAIEIEGLAQAYSGAKIDGASVNYRVVRTPRIPYYYFGYSRGFNFNTSETEIAQGTVTTDEKGIFKVTFEALPDPEIKGKDIIFDYKIYADVTDIAGETRSGTQFLSVSEQSLHLDMFLERSIDKDKPQKWNIRSSNTQGEFQPAQGTVQVYQIESPTFAKVERLWESPDKTMYSQEAWEAVFPHQPYGAEIADPSQQPKKSVFNANFDTEDTSALSIEEIKNWDSGKYLIELKAKDKDGQEVMYKQLFTLFSPNDSKIPEPALDYAHTIKYTGQPGENAQFIIGSSEDIKVFYEVLHKNERVQKEWISINNEQKIVEVPIEEKHRGGFTVQYHFVHQNRYFNHSIPIRVPWTNKELKVEFETYRDKLEPGAKDTWRLRIKDFQGDQVAAEMLATLYDASLDVFRKNNWRFSIYPNDYSSAYWNSNVSNYPERFYSYQISQDIKGYRPTYDEFNWFGGLSYGGFAYARRSRNMARIEGGLAEADMAFSEEVDEAPMSAGAPPPTESVQSELYLLDVDKDDRLIASGKKKKAEEATRAEQTEAEVDQEAAKVQVRTNFNETAFFMPELKTDKNGDVLIEFTMPEALTRWRMLGFAHTKDLEYTIVENSLITQKELMVVPNAPRFFREGDQMIFTSKVTNLSDKDLEGNIDLNLFNALDEKKINDLCNNQEIRQTFTVPAGQSRAYAWSIKIPEGLAAIKYQVVAKAGRFSDGEEMSLPVLSNRTLVTETLPLPIRGNQSKEFAMEKLLNSSQSSTLTHKRLTLEFTANPAWYAVQSLPYLMDFPHECSEQIFSRFYANALAAHITQQKPKIQEVFTAWRELSPDAFLSNLDKNPELKAVALEETPWIFDANDESENKKRLALYFDLNRMTSEQDRAITQLMSKMRNGGWPWFEGMPIDRYITQHIITGIGHLDHLGVNVLRRNQKVQNMTSEALAYLDREIKEDYEKLLLRVKKGQAELSARNIRSIQIQYLYARSFFKNRAIPKESAEAIKYYQQQVRNHWLKFGQYEQGMIALALHRAGDTDYPGQIVASLKERALVSEELGMYWKKERGYFWYQAPIETQALMIEVFEEIAKDSQAVDELKTWLLKQKQTQNWRTTRATAEACYALLLKGSDWLSEDPQLDITLGSQKISPFDEANVLPVEAGTGYFKTSWNQEDIQAEMGNITVSKRSDGIAWGALYWQYLEDLDKITPAETPLKLRKQLFLQKNSDTGPVLTPLKDNNSLKVGDLIKVRIELRADRAMEYVHMKDMRSSGLEPTQVISQYKYQDGLHYYESTRDAATHFFFGYLPKGTYVFEYPLRVTHQGDFSNGITSIQCMYAPEFSSHSEGVRVQVKE